MCLFGMALLVWCAWSCHETMHTNLVSSPHEEIKLNVWLHETSMPIASGIVYQPHLCTWCECQQWECSAADNQSVGALEASYGDRAKTG